MLGIFDSGIGGLTVIRELMHRYPRASFTYLGDTARTPYGNKTPEVIQRYAVEVVSELLKRGAQDIVVACNAVSANALGVLRTTFPNIRFFDVIAPVIEEVRKLGAKKIGILGTRATIASGVYERALSDREVVSASCPLLVPLVEEGWLNRAETKRIVRSYLSSVKRAQVDVLILGCTHYPLVEPIIRRALSRRTKIVSTPKALVDLLEREAPECLQGVEAHQQYLFTDAAPHTRRIAERFLGQPITIEDIQLDRELTV